MKEAHILKRKLSHFVVSPLDKNGGMLHIMCRNNWHRTYEVVFTDEQLYKPIEHSLEIEKDKQYRASMEKGLDSIAPWNGNGELPESYFLTKDKDLNKQRPVVTAWNHPAKQALKICAKGGTMLLKSASKLKHFGITSTNQAWKALWNPDMNLTDHILVSFDVNQMFTSLPHGDIETTVLGFIQIMHAEYESPFFHVYKSDGKHAHPGKSPCKKQAYQATLTQIWLALEFEMTHMAFQWGGLLKLMIEGLGIGGTMSPFGACALCVYKEHIWQSSIWKNLKGPLRGARLVDDLPIVFDVRDVHWIKKMQSDCYGEKIVPELDGKPSTKVDALECSIALTTSAGLVVVARNKNEDSIMKTGKMHYMRYPHQRSQCAVRIKRAFIMGTIHRYVGLTSPNAYDLLWKPILNLYTGVAPMWISMVGVAKHIYWN